MKYCSRSCSVTANNRNRICKQSTKDKLSIIQKRNLSGCINNKTSMANSLKTRKTIAKEKYFSFKCKNCNKEVISNKKQTYCSLTCYRSSGNCGGFKKNSTKKHRSIYKNYQMDSGAELSFAKLLDEHNIKWIKNDSTYFTFIDSFGKQRKYYPDFYLPYFDKWVEIKGKYYIRKDDDLRLKSVGNIILIMSDNINSILAILPGVEPGSPP